MAKDMVAAQLDTAGQNMKRVKVHMGYGTHVEALAWALARIGPGPVLEMGSGLFSTPVLHGFCEGAGRPLLTVETDKVWGHANRALWSSDGHTWTENPDPPEGEWALVFIDGVEADRPRWIDHFRDTGSIVVCHDTGARRALDEAVEKYAHRRVFDRLRPNTTAAWS